MRKFIILAIFLFTPFKAFAGFPEGEKGYDYKKIIKKKGLQDSNLRPSAPKTPYSILASLGF